MMEENLEENVTRKVTFMTTVSQIEMVDAWRYGVRPMPSRNAALRLLVRAGLIAASGSGQPADILAE